MIELKTDPTPRELRQFAGLWFPAFGLVVASLLWKAGWTQITLGWIGVVALIALAGLVNPRWIKPVFVGLIYLTFPIGWVVSHVLMIGVFYLILVPTGLIMRLIGYDPLRRRLDREAETYWIERPEPSSPKRYFRQF